MAERMVQPDTPEGSAAPASAADPAKEGLAVGAIIAPTQRPWAWWEAPLGMLFALGAIGLLLAVPATGILRFGTLAAYGLCVLWGSIYAKRMGTAIGFGTGLAATVLAYVVLMNAV